MGNVTELKRRPRRLDLTVEVLDILLRHDEATAHEIAQTIAAEHGYQATNDEIVNAIHRLLQEGWRVEARNDVDAVRYALVTGGTAA